MGWTCFTPERGARTEELLRSELGGERGYEILGIAVRKAEFYDVGVRSSVAYLAVRSKNYPTPSALVVLVTRKNGAFCYKDMSEDMGPNEDHCPESILRLLGPITGDEMGYARAWRERAWANLGKAPPELRRE